MAIPVYLWLEDDGGAKIKGSEDHEEDSVQRLEGGVGVEDRPCDGSNCDRKSGRASASVSSGVRWPESRPRKSTGTGVRTCEASRDEHAQTHLIYGKAVTSPIRPDR